MNQNKFCKNCGCPLQEGDMFCKNCGTKVDNDNVSNNVNAENNNMTNNVQQMNNGNMQYNPMQGNGQMYYNNKKSTPVGLYIFIALVVISLIGVGVYFVVIKPNQSTNTPISNDNKNNQTQATTNVYFEGYNFAIPTNLKGEVDGDTLKISDKNYTWYAAVKVTYGSYDTMVSNQSLLISELEKQGLHAKNAKRNYYSGMDCLTMETNYLGQDMILAYVKFSSTKVFVVTVGKSFGGGFPYDLFSDVMKIINNAK